MLVFFEPRDGILSAKRSSEVNFEKDHMSATSALCWESGWILAKEHWLQKFESQEHWVIEMKV